MNNRHEFTAPVIADTLRERARRLIGLRRSGSLFGNQDIELASQHASIEVKVVESLAKCRRVDVE
jgi:hypothetical protein